MFSDPWKSWNELATSDTNVTTELSAEAMNSRRVSLSNRMEIVLKPQSHKRHWELLGLNKN